MQQILKRLELIKTGIALEDEDIVELQVVKIKSLTYDSDVANILAVLDASDFSMAVNAIEIYMGKNTGLALYADNELQGLKLELKVLERKLQALAERKNDCDADVDEFNHEYSLNLGQIIQQVLGLREEILHQKFMVKEQAFRVQKEQYDKVKIEVEEIKKQTEILEDELDSLDEFSDDYDEVFNECQKLKEELIQKEQDLNEKRKFAKQAKTQLDDDPITDEYEDAKQDAEEFGKDYDNIIAEESCDLDAEQQKELKYAYRKASRLCHPDIVADELKEQACSIMAELNAAKKKKDLARVKEMLCSLEAGEGFDVASDTIQDKDVLKAKIITTKKNIDLLEAELSELLASDEYKKIQDIGDNSEYFESTKVLLEEESERLKVELQQLKGDSDALSQQSEYCVNNTPAENQENEFGKVADEYWSEEF